jgi:hypothetical protein
MDRSFDRLLGGLAAMLLIGGAICVGVALRTWFATARRARVGGLADGVVVERIPGSNGDANGVTIFEFSDPRGVRHRASMLTKAAPHYLGERVRVRYDPNDPENADIVVPSGSAFAFGLVCLVFGAGAAFVWWHVAVARQR